MRIHSLDILRGFALLGMFIVHFHANSSDATRSDEVIRTLIWRLVESKSHGTFALLFGAGFAIQLRRAAQRGDAFVVPYLRRLGVLACFGFAAHALFGYNVLLGYATWGVALLLIRTWPTRRLIALAMCSAVSVSLYHAIVSGANTGTAAQVMSALRAAEMQDSYVVLLGARLRHMAWFYSQPFFFLPGATLTLFIVGMLFVRLRVFEDIDLRRNLLAAMAAFGFASWLADNWLLPGVGLATTWGVVRDQWLTFTYVAAVLLLLRYWRAAHPIVQPVANAGRMALTNYLLQIAFLDLLFSGYALGLQEVPAISGVAAAMTCFAVEAAISTMWLARFQHGPAEWLWRRLTYGGWRSTAERQAVTVTERPDAAI